MAEIGFQFSVGGWGALSDSRWRSLILPGVAAIGVVLFLFHRNSTLFLDPQFWAEDLDVYFVQDRLLGFKALLAPHNGFVQLSCRIIAWIAGFAPPIHAPRLYATMFIASIGITAVVAYTSPAFRGLAKPLAALALLAAPVNSEVFYGMSYTPWVMGPLVALALYERNPSCGRSLTLASCYALIGFSSPFTLIAAPFAAIKFWRERTRFALSLVLLTVAAAAIQFSYVYDRFTVQSAHGNTLAKISAFVSLFYRWAIGPRDLAWMPVSLIGIAYLVGTFVYLWRSRAVAAHPFIYFFTFGLLLLAISCASADASFHMHQFSANARYFYIPTVLLLWTFLAVEHHFARSSVSIPGFAILMAFLFAKNVIGVEATYRDTKWSQVVLCLRTETGCTAAINPWPLGFRKIPTDHELQLMNGDASKGDTYL